MTIIGRHFLVTELTSARMIGFICMYNTKNKEHFECDKQWYNKSGRFVNIIKQSRRDKK